MNQYPVIKLNPFVPPPSQSKKNKVQKFFSTILKKIKSISAQQVEFIFVLVFYLFVGMCMGYFLTKAI